ncbi:winged helix-turn-helix domain-containing protein [Erwinia persicina]|uniref:winged helix-turn-helix domain-containing protein n=1 Tax=Erwinia persicina TaxID=55211 RepID=UPI001784B00D|nr:winged helix-turn-helix domain-containing protein [Erwinia persicina]MBD8214712.1 winged helix-turn-helix domain-containing protein [Erwinia persicina]
MEYLINHSVKFNPVDCTLFSPGFTVDMITITRLSSDLLVLFVENNQVPLSRETILNKLWENRGLSASSNNLNNYVSILRKVMKQCGSPGVITTIPKYGFLFNAEVVRLDETEVVPADRPVESAIKEQESYHDEIKPETTLKVVPEAGDVDIKKRNVNPVLYLMLPLMIVSLAITGLFPEVYNYFRLSSIRSEILRIDHCRVYLIDDVTRRMDSDWVTAEINVILSREGISCHANTNIYFSGRRILDEKKDPAVGAVLSYCPFASQAPCDNYNYYRYEGAHDQKK